MPYKISFDTNNRVFTIVNHGRVTLGETESVFGEALELGTKEGSYLYLLDYRDAELAITTSELYYLPRALADKAKILGVEIMHIKRAIVACKKTDDYKFFETVAYNYGQTSAKVFSDIKEANDWLIEQGDTPSTRPDDPLRP